MSIIPKTPAQLADSYGKLLAEKAALAKREKALKAAIKATRQYRLQGKAFDVVVSTLTDQTVFDTTLAKKLLGPVQAGLCVKPKADSLRFTCKARVAEAA